MLIYISGSFKIVNRSRATYWLVLLDNFHMTRLKFYLYKYFLEDLKLQTIHSDKNSCFSLYSNSLWDFPFWFICLFAVTVKFVRNLKYIPIFPLAQILQWHLESWENYSFEGLEMELRINLGNTNVYWLCTDKLLWN